MRQTVETLHRNALKTRLEDPPLGRTGRPEQQKPPALLPEGQKERSPSRRPPGDDTGRKKKPVYGRQLNEPKRDARLESRGPGIPKIEELDGAPGKRPGLPTSPAWALGPTLAPFRDSARRTPSAPSGPPARLLARQTPFITSFSALTPRNFLGI